ncbi:MAG: TRAP transporter small permease subunit [Chloroflexota bacterium]|nr:TRAP transporter small permease subunit [Chloroflexota bacterium]
METLIKFSRIVDRISERLGWVSMMIVLLTLVVGFYNVVARYVGRFIGVQLSSNFFIELQWYLYSLVFLLGFAYILKHEINVRVDFIYANWPPKKKAMLNFLGHIFFLIPFTILGILVTINPVLRSWGRLPGGGWTSWEVSPDPGGLPRAPLKTMIIVAFVLLLLQTISELIKLWLVLKGKEEYLTLDKRDPEIPLRVE